MAAMYSFFVVLLLGYQLPAIDTHPTMDYTSAAVCEADQEWRFGDRGEDCYCKPQYNVSDVADIIPEPTCGVFTMKATFRKCQMKDLGAYFSKDDILDGKCITYLEDRDKNTLSLMVDLKNGTCGVLSIEAKTQVTYQRIFNITLHNGEIIRHDRLIVRLSCVYELDMITSLNTVLRPIISSVEVDIDGIGQFVAYMALYQDSEYRTPFQESGVSLSVKDMLYIGTFIKGGDEDEYDLVMKNCYATPTEYRDDPKKYYIIKDRCPNKQDKTITVHENGVSRKGRVSVQFFKFVGDTYDKVYLHCAVSLCNKKKGNCVPSCGARSRNTDTDLEITGLRIGPIKLSERSHGIIGAQTSWALMFPFMLFLVHAIYF